jgi:hypothetical protein
VSAAAFLRVKKLTGANIVKTAAAHNHRAIAAEVGSASHIDASRCAQNVHTAGPDTPAGVAELAQALMSAAGVGKLRKDAVRAVEVVFSLPADGAGVDAPAYFAQCLAWASATFGPVLTADAHHDEATPHLHVICLPLVHGRMVGSDLVGGPSRLRAMQTDFHEKVAKGFGLKRGTTRMTGASRQDTAAAVLAHLRAIGDPVLKSAAWPVIRDAIERDPKPYAETLGFEVSSASKLARSFTSIMTSVGKGAKTHAEQERRDRALMRSKRIGFGGSDDAPDGPKTGPESAPPKTRTLALCRVPSPRTVSKLHQTGQKSIPEGGANRAAGAQILGSST